MDNSDEVNVKNKNASDLFWVTFIGEYVEVLCKFETPDSGRMPLAVQGYMLDADDKFYYIGKNPLEIASAVNKNDVAYVCVIDNIDPAVQILENMPVPEAEEETN